MKILFAALIAIGALNAAADEPRIPIESRSDHTAPSPFVGQWCNKDFNTGGVTRVHFRQEGDKLLAHMWGRCHPSECDWGKETATLADDGSVSLTWNQGFCITTQKLKLLADGTLELANHTHYTDNSGRPDKDYKYRFAKGLIHDWSDPIK